MRQGASSWEKNRRPQEKNLAIFYRGNFRGIWFRLFVLEPGPRHTICRHEHRLLTPTATSQWLLLRASHEYLDLRHGAAYHYQQVYRY